MSYEHINTFQQKEKKKQKKKNVQQQQYILTLLYCCPTNRVHYRNVILTHLSSGSIYYLTVKSEKKTGIGVNFFS